MPNERTRALLRARELMIELSLVTSSEQLLVLRDRAETELRHYPDQGEIEFIAKSNRWLEWPY
jgi:hypothetical protein